MRVYVETNFLLELAFEQEQHAACEAILRLAEARDIALALPAYSLIEAADTLRRKLIERNALMDSNSRELREVGRMEGHTRSVGGARSMMTILLVHTLQHARGRFERIKRRLSNSASFLPLTGVELDEASALEMEYGLSQPDARVLASVLGDPQLGRATSCFLNRNTRDFDESRIHDLLAQQSCKLLGNFENGRNYIEAMRARAG
jgi:predicted nucleic acid-binding protein